MADYLGRLEDGLRAEGFRGRRTSVDRAEASSQFAEAASRPVETIISGPAAGVVGVAKLSQRLALDVAIAADVGGTSFDTALVLSARFRFSTRVRSAICQSETPWVDVHSIGAGGARSPTWTRVGSYESARKAPEPFRGRRAMTWVEPGRRSPTARRSSGCLRMAILLAARASTSSWRVPP